MFIKKKINVFLILFLTAVMLFSMDTWRLQAYAVEADEKDTLKVAHYNILGNVRMNRNYVVDELLAYDPDLISLNEVDMICLDQIIEKFERKGYSHYTLTDWAPDTIEYKQVKAGWHNIAFYKSNSFILLDSGSFSLSDTPEKEHTFISYMDSEIKVTEGRPRVCNWVYLENKATGGKFIFASVHAQAIRTQKYDYNDIGMNALGQMLSELKDDYNCEVICGGDLNTSNPKSALKYGFSTANNGVATHQSGGAIDSVLYSDGIILDAFSVGPQSQSDHMPVFATLKVPVTDDFTDSEITLIIFSVAAVVVLAVLFIFTFILSKRKKERNRISAEKRLAEMRAKLAEYENLNKS